MKRALILTALLVSAVPAWAQNNPCPVTASTPQFTAGGNVFGRIASQWNAYFGNKVDVNHGTLCYPTIYPPISGTAFADPTATVGVVVVPGTATTAMRSDASPPIPKASASTYGAMKVDNTTQSATDGVVSTKSTTINTVTCTPGGSCTIPTSGVTGLANPTATIGTSPVNGTATTAMRSDAAPAIPQCSSSTFGACKVDGTTISATSGIISATAVGANPTATAGASAVNGSAATFMRSDAAPAVVAATTSTAGIAKLHNVGFPAGWVATVNPNNAVVVTVNQASTISAIIGRVETPTGSAATVSVYKAPSGTACSGGTILHSGSFDANGTAATNQTLAVTTSTLAAGDSVCFQTTGTTSWTGGVGIGTITVFFSPS